MSNIFLKNRYFKLTIVIRFLASFIIFSLVMEVCARIDDKIKYDAPFFAPYDSSMLRTKDSDGIRHNVPNSRYEKWKINRFGFRGQNISLQKPKNVKRIICMGTSETFGLFETPGKEWPSQLTALLGTDRRFQVINTSVVGLSLDTLKSYMNKYVFQFEPDTVILYINPFFYAIQMLRHTTKQYNPKTNHQKKTQISAGHFFKKVSFSPRIFPKIKQSIKKITPPQALKRYQVWNLSKQVEDLELQTLKGKKPLDVIPQEILASFEKDLTDLVNYLIKKRIEVILSSYPILISKDNIAKHPEIFLDFRRFSIYFSFQGIVDAPPKFNAVIERVSTDLGVGFVNNQELVPKDIKFFGDNVHYTDKGAELVALSFANYLKNHR